MMNKSWRKGVVAIAVSAAIGLTSVTAYAADGGIVGSISGVDAAGYTVTIKNKNTGLTRDIVVDASGSFRFPQLPVGEYEVTVAKGGKVEGKQNLNVSLAGNAVANFEFGNRGGAEVIEVVGARPSAVDLTSTDSGLIVTNAEIEALPVGRNLTAVALLAPGTVQGDAAFGNLASFGGSSVAENACFINGVEVTDTRQGLGCGNFPFSAYKEFQVKTGGYSAYYGRSTGGIINAVTKSGGNEWQFSGEVYHTPESLTGDRSYSTGSNGKRYFDLTHDRSDFTEASFSASGPIIQDKLFVYALVNPRWNEQDFSSGGATGRTARAQDRFTKQEASGSDNLFWTAKVDWDITSDHRLEAFAYSDRRDTTSTIYAWNIETGAIGAAESTNLLKRGSEVNSLTYVGHLTDDITLKVMRAEVHTEFNNVLSNLTCAAVNDNRLVKVPVAKSCGPGGGNGTNVDDNEQTRLDLEWALGDHIVRVGADYQDRNSINYTTPIGGGVFTYDTILAGAGAELGIPWTNTAGKNVDIVSKRVFATESGNGGFGSTSDAIYIEDVWTVNDQLTLSLGYRSDTFENFSADGTTFAGFSDQKAPRLGASWDPTGDGTSKIFANWGRYYLGIPNNTNFRVASGIGDRTSYYYFTGINAADGTPTGLTPVTGNLTTSTVVNSQPVTPHKSSFQSQEATAFYKEELILGYQFEISPEYSAVIRGTYRDTPSAVDDFCGHITDWCTLIVPGKANTWTADHNYDGVPDGPAVTYSKEEIGLDPAHLEYHAINAELSHRSAKLRWDVSYTWARSFGNFEGAVKSDIGQADAGITQDFDFAALMDGADGYLPNDRRHVIKFNGVYQITDDFSVAWNSLLSSGKPYNAFGRSYGGTMLREGSYGDYFYQRVACPDTNGNGKCDTAEKVYTRTARGDAGRLPWTFNTDLQFDYKFNLAGMDMTASLEIFNIFNSQEVIKVVEHAEASEGNPNPLYRTPYQWQAPRTMRIGLRAEF